MNRVKSPNVIRNRNQILDLATVKSQNSESSVSNSDKSVCDKEELIKESPNNLKSGIRHQILSKFHGNCKDTKTNSQTFIENKNGNKLLSDPDYSTEKSGISRDVITTNIWQNLRMSINPKGAVIPCLKLLPG
jgi:hypothetical protein